MSISTDNRTVSDTTLTDEFMLCIEHCQLTYHEIKKINLMAIKQSFASKEVKERISQQIENQFDETTMMNQ